MTCEQIIRELQKFPPHFEVQAALIHLEIDDETADFGGASNDPCSKIVYLELDGRLS